VIATNGNHPNHADSSPDSPPIAHSPLPVASSPLLNAYFASGCNAFALAASEKLSAQDLLDWSTNPAVQAQLAALRSLAEHSLALRTAQARLTALDILESVAKTSDDPIERRRAAAAIMRSPASPRAHAAPPRDPDPADDDADDDEDLDESPEAETDEIVALSQSYLAPSPCPKFTVETVAGTFREALYAPTEPRVAIRPFNLLAEKATCRGQVIPRDPHEYLSFFAKTFAHDTVIASHSLRFACEDRLNADRAGYVISLRPQAGSPHSEFFVELHRAPFGPHAGCWFITRLERMTPREPKPDTS